MKMAERDMTVKQAMTAERAFPNCEWQQNWWSLHEFCASYEYFQFEWRDPVGFQKAMNDYLGLRT